jgi:hypothetical protein
MVHVTLMGHVIFMFVNDSELEVTGLRRGSTSEKMAFRVSLEDGYRRKLSRVEMVHVLNIRQWAKIYMYKTPSPLNSCVDLKFANARPLCFASRTQPRRLLASCFPVQLVCYEETEGKLFRGQGLAFFKLQAEGNQLFLPTASQLLRCDQGRRR